MGKDPPAAKDDAAIQRAAQERRRADIALATRAAERQAYRKQAETVADQRRLEADRANGERMIRQLLQHPTPQGEALLNQGFDHEERGRLEEACALYERVLAKEPHNHELRAYVAAIARRLNERAVRAKAARLEQEVAARLQVKDNMVLPGPGGAAAQAPAQARPLRRRGEAAPPQQVAGAAPGVGHGHGAHREANKSPHKQVGPMMAMHPEAYRAVLADQAREARLRRDAAKREEQRLGRNQLAIAEAQAALELAKQILKGNSSLGWRAERAEELHARERERGRQYMIEWEELREAQQMQRHHGNGPLAGVDEYARRRAHAQVAHDHLTLEHAARIGPPDVDYLYHAAHGYDMDRLPRRPASAVTGGPAGGRSAAAARPPSAPFARPYVDRPVQRVDPAAVRAKQQAFYAKHRKPEPLPVQQVPMRVRMEADKQNRR